MLSSATILVQVEILHWTDDIFLFAHTPQKWKWFLSQGHSDHSAETHILIVKLVLSTGHEHSLPQQMPGFQMAWTWFHCLLHFQCMRVGIRHHLYDPFGEASEAYTCPRTGEWTQSIRSPCQEGAFAFLELQLCSCCQIVKANWGLAESIIPKGFRGSRGASSQ